MSSTEVVRLSFGEAGLIVDRERRLRGVALVLDVREPLVRFRGIDRGLENPVLLLQPQDRRLVALRDRGIEAEPCERLDAGARPEREEGCR
jgi:hypothetical protein